MKLMHDKLINSTFKKNYEELWEIMKEFLRIFEVDTVR